MTITSKPRDGENIIVEVDGILNSKKRIASPVLQAFFDDLAELFNGDTIDLSQVFQLAAQVQVGNAGARNQIQSLAAKSANAGTLAALIAAVGALKANQARIESRLKNMENLCLSNLVR